MSDIKIGGVDAELGSVISQFDRLTKCYEAQARAVEQLGKKTGMLSSYIAAQDAATRINIAAGDRSAFLRTAETYSRKISQVKEEVVSLKRQLADLNNSAELRLFNTRNRISVLTAPKATRTTAEERRAISESLYPESEIFKAERKAKELESRVYEKLAERGAKTTTKEYARETAKIVQAEQDRQETLSRIQQDYEKKTFEAIATLEDKRQQEATKKLQSNLIEREKLKIASEAGVLKASIEAKGTTVAEKGAEFKGYTAGMRQTVSGNADIEAKNTERLVSSEKSLQASRNKLAGILRNYRTELRAVREETLGLSSTAKNSFDQIVDAQRNAANDLKNSYMRSFSYIRMAFVNQLAGMVSRGLYAIITEAENSVKAARDAEVWAARISTISQENQLSFENWRQEGMKVSNQFGYMLNDVMAAGYTVISDQITKGADAFRFLGEAAKLARVGVVTLDQSVQALDATLNSYGLSQQYTEQVSASLFKTMELGRLTLDEVSNEVGRFAPIAYQLGITFDEVNAALAAMTIQGMKFQVSSTLMRNIMLKLVKPTKEMNSLFEEWGVTTGEGAIAAFGFQGVLERVLKEVEIGGTRKLGKLAGEIRSITGYTALLADGGKRYSEYLSKLTNAQSSYQKAVEYTMSTTAVQWDMQIQAAKNFLQMDIGDTVLSWFTVANDAGISFKTVLEKVLDAAKALSAYMVARHVVVPLATSAIAPSLASRAARQESTILETEIQGLLSRNLDIKKQISAIDAQSLQTGKALSVDDIVRMQTLQEQSNIIKGRQAMVALELEKQKAILATEGFRYKLMGKMLLKSIAMSFVYAGISYAIWQIVSAVQKHIEYTNALSKANKQLNAIYLLNNDTHAEDVATLKKLNLQYAEYRRNVTALVLDQKKAVENAKENIEEALERSKKQWEASWKAVIDRLKSLSEESAEQIRKSFELSREISYGPVGGNFDRVYESISNVSEEWKKAQQNLALYVKEQQGLLSGPKTDKWFKDTERQLAGLQKIQAKNPTAQRGAQIAGLQRNLAEANYVRERQTTGSEANIQAKQIGYLKNWLIQQGMLRRQAYTEAVGPRGVTDEFALSRGRDISKAIMSRVKELKDLGLSESGIQAFEAAQNKIQQELEATFRDQREKQANALAAVYNNAQKDYRNFQTLMKESAEKGEKDPERQAEITKALVALETKYSKYADIVKMFEQQYTSDTALQATLSPFEKLLRDGNTSTDAIKDAVNNVAALVAQQNQLESYDRFLTAFQGIKDNIAAAREEARLVPSGEKAKKEAMGVLAGNKDISEAIAKQLEMAIARGKGAEARNLYERRIAQIQESQLALSYVSGSGAEAFSNKLLAARVKEKNKGMTDAEAEASAIQMRNTLFNSPEVRKLLEKAIGTPKGLYDVVGTSPDVRAFVQTQVDAKIADLIQTGRTDLPAAALNDLAANIQILMSKEMEALEKLKQPLDEIQKSNFSQYVSGTLKAGTTEQNLAWLENAKQAGATQEDLQRYATLFAQFQETKTKLDKIEGLLPRDKEMLGKAFQGVSTGDVSQADIEVLKEYNKTRAMGPKGLVDRMIEGAIENLMPNYPFSNKTNILAPYMPNTPVQTPIYRDTSPGAQTTQPVASNQVVNVDANLYLDGRAVASVVLPYINRDTQNNNNTGRTRRGNAVS